MSPLRRLVRALRKPPRVVLRRLAYEASVRAERYRAPVARTSLQPRAPPARVRGARPRLASGTGSPPGPTPRTPRPTRRSTAACVPATRRASSPPPRSALAHRVRLHGARRHRARPADRLAEGLPDRGVVAARVHAGHPLREPERRQRRQVPLGGLARPVAAAGGAGLPAHARRALRRRRARGAGRLDRRRTRTRTRSTGPRRSRPRSGS